MSKVDDIIKIDSPEIRLSLTFAAQYEANPKVWLGLYIKCGSVRNACKMIVGGYKVRGLFDGCLQACEGKDFREYADRLNLADKWKPVLADMLVIIYSTTSYSRWCKANKWVEKDGCMVNEVTGEQVTKQELYDIFQS